MNSIQTQHPVALRYLLDDSLYDIGEEKSFELPIWGRNGAGVYFIHESPGNEHLPFGEMEAFTKTISALGLTENQSALINIGKALNLSQADFLSICKPSSNTNSPNKIILLGEDLYTQHSFFGTALSLNSAVHLPHLHAEVLSTTSFSEMLENVEKKKAFWNALKNFLS